MTLCAALPLPPGEPPLHVTALFVTLCLVAPAFGGDPKTDESAIGGGFEWMVLPCENWNCAAAKLILADGNSTVLVLPMTAGEHPWIVLRRVRAGSFHVPDDAPVKVDCFDSMPLATTRYDGLTRHAPTLLTAPDGKTLVVYTTQPNAERRTISRRR